MIVNKVVYFMERNQLETYLKEMRALLKALEFGLKEAISKYYDLYKNEDCEFIKSISKAN